LRTSASSAANPPDSFAFPAVGAGFPALQLVSLKSHAAFWRFAGYAWLPKNLKSSCQVANSDWPLSFHGTGRSLQYLLRTLLKKLMPETSAYCVGLIGQTHAFTGNLRLAIRMSHLSSKC
jgi:hypothetical protein